MRPDADQLSEGHFVLNTEAMFSLQRRYLSARLLCRNPDDPTVNAFCAAKTSYDKLTLCGGLWDTDLCFSVVPVSSGVRSFHGIDKLNKPHDESDIGAEGWEAVTSRQAKPYIDWCLWRRRESLWGQRPGFINVE